MGTRPLLGIFVGGKSRRMGAPKGLLEVPGSGEPIIESIVRAGREAGFDPVLVGNATPYSKLAPGVPRVDDDPPDAGPLGGLRAVLLHAIGQGNAPVVTTACDMPYVTKEALGLLLDQRSDAEALAPRRKPDGPWEPMLARYDAPRVLIVLDAVIASGRRSFQELFAALRAEPMKVAPVLERALTDWDAPEDVGA